MSPGCSFYLVFIAWEKYKPRPSLYRGKVAIKGSHQYPKVLPKPPKAIIASMIMKKKVCSLPHVQARSMNNRSSKSQPLFMQPVLAGAVATGAAQPHPPNPPNMISPPLIIGLFDFPSNILCTCRINVTNFQII